MKKYMFSFLLLRTRNDVMTSSHYAQISSFPHYYSFFNEPYALIQNIQYKC